MKQAKWTIIKKEKGVWAILWWNNPYEVLQKIYKTPLGANKFGLNNFGAKNFIREDFN